MNNTNKKKKKTLIIIILVWTTTSFGQITTTEVAEKVIETSTTKYDSSRNFLGSDVYGYIGQELYLRGKPESLRKYGYDGFVIDYTESKYSNRNKNVYKCCESFNSKYDELVGKYFVVDTVYKHPKAKQSAILYGSKYYLALTEKESGDKLFYEYSTLYSHSFPFVVVGFFEKEKERLKGQHFVFADKVLASSNDITTGKSITQSQAQIWKYVDLTVDEKYYNLSLIIENDLGEKTFVSWETVYGKWSRGKSYTLKEAAKYELRFGRENWLLILEGKIRVGFTEEMVRLSWGRPKEINRSSYSDQWVYESQYLYFENGKLKSYN